MKIALLTDGISPFVIGGMQRHSANLAKYFTLAGVEVTLVHCIKYNDKIPSNENINYALFGEDTFHKLNQIITLHFPKSGKIPGHYIRNSFSYSKSIYESLNWNEFDFVYAKGFCGWYYMKQKNKGIKLPPIGVKFHGYEMFQSSVSLAQKIQAKILQKATRWNTQQADVVFSYGGEITHLIQKQLSIPNYKIIELTSGIDKEWIRKDEIVAINNSIRFVFVGRNEKRKGIEDLNKAISALIKDKIIDFEFHFIGPIPKEIQITFENIRYHGELKSKQEIISVLDQMDVLVCPSHSEGMPNVILEAMSRGLAIIATDVGAVNQIVDNNVGKLIPPFDIEKLKFSLESMIQLEQNELIQYKIYALEKLSSKFEWSVLIDNLVHKINLKLKDVN